MTAHGRLTWGLSILTLLTLGAAFAIIAVLLDREQEKQLDTALLDVAHVEAAEAPGNHFSFTARPGPAANDVGPLDKYGVIFDDGGNVLAATPPFDAAPPRLGDFAPAIDRPFDFMFGGRAYRGVLASIPGYPNHRVLLASSRDDLDGDSRYVRQAMLIALGVSTAWLTLMIGWMVRRNMREHRRIAEILHQLAEGDVTARVAGEVSDRDLRQVGTDVDAIAKRLAQVLEQRRRFIAHAAHELRSPLTALRGGLQQALRKERSAEEYRASLGFLFRASDRLTHLADELLELARAEQAPVASGPVSVDLVLGDVVDSLRPLAEEKRVVVNREVTDASVRADPRDLERIVRNLLDNAIRHSPEGGEVRLEVERGDVVRVRVRDQGSGVPPGERERVFSPFHRSADARRDARGAGLGLAIARELARRHGGDVVVGEEDGSSFVVSLPSPRTDMSSAACEDGLLSSPRRDERSQPA